MTLPADFRILQPLSPKPVTVTDPVLHEPVRYVPNDLAYVRWGILPNRAARPLVTVPSGSAVMFDVLSHEGLLEDQGRDPAAFFGRYGIPPDKVLEDAQAVTASGLLHNFYRDGPHVISPPVAVEGAMPGDVLRIDVLRLEPRVPYGVNAIRHGLGALPAEFPVAPSTEPGADAAHPQRFHDAFFVLPLQKKGAETWVATLPTGGGREAEVPVHPFLGVMGVAVDTDQLPNSVPPGNYGGNLDLHHLTEGATLYLPVLVPGAQFYVSDSHFGQGDGEVSLTAIEGSVRATLRLTLLKHGLPGMPSPLAMPFAENADYWIPVGVEPELDEAMVTCIHQGLAFLTGPMGFAPNNAFAYLSVAANFNVSEVVDHVMEVHALLPKANFRWVPPPPPAPAAVTGPILRP